MRKNIFQTLLFISLTICSPSQAQVSNNKTIYPIAFYNVENLYHPQNTDKLTDKEYSPKGVKAWTMEKYNKKLSNLTYVIKNIAKEHNGVAILGLAEIGNKKVIEDLINTKDLKDQQYKIIHYDSPDRRGIDVGLVYNPKQYKATASILYPYILPNNPYFKTRDQLLVRGTLNGETLYIIINHWPSRYGEKSGELREHAASITKHITDSLRKVDPKGKIIIMGDMNDNPTDKSVRLILQAKKTATQTGENELFNTTWPLFDKGIGTSMYRGKWNLFDQIIISGNLLKENKSELKFWKTEVFNKDYLIQQKGKFKGYPLRTFSGNTFLNGYSDHLPIVLYLVKEKTN